MDECKICWGHGYYYIPADVGGTASDKKKVCKACWGTGLGDRHEEKAGNILNDATDSVNLCRAIATALASAESDLLKRMMEPSEGMKERGSPLVGGQLSLGKQCAHACWCAMLTAFAKENNIDLEVEDVDG